MIHLKYPEANFKLKKNNGQHYVFDTIRKTWLLLTEEEWVRQNFVHYLIEEQHYPVSFIALEKELELHGLKKRFDILVYNKDHKPWMLVECKASHVVLNEVTLQQVLRYNISIPVSYIVITNGPLTYAWMKSKTGLSLLQQLPRWFEENP